MPMGMQRVFSSHIPDWVTDAQCDIYDMGLCASRYGLCHVSELLHSVAVISRRGNRGATKTLVRGSCQ